jgi:Family of unknown function (DUF5681)
MLVTEMTDNAAPRHSGQWKKGQSGNPAGMPKGTRHRATMRMRSSEFLIIQVRRGTISLAVRRCTTSFR